MQEQYQHALKEVGKYIHFLEEILLSYESKLKDMELDDMIEHQKKYPGKSKYYYNRQEDNIKMIGNNTPADGDDAGTEESYYQWMYSKTEGNDSKARGEALNKAYARAQYEIKLDNNKNS
tara:strand:- start:57 stop:416 length:360 start_codon:yes stop_codon:yes gene_type:complete